MTPRKDMITQVVLVVLSILVLYFGYLTFNLQRQVDVLTEKIENLEQTTVQVEEFEQYKGQASAYIDELAQSFYDIQQNIYDLYEMNLSHANCVAMAMLVNEQSVLADEYDRTEEEQGELYSNDSKYCNLYGRLYVPDAKIDVALYTGNTQSICDRQDSANIFTFGLQDGDIIADHCNQEFRKLFSVEVGTQGYIRLVNGDIINIKCTEVFNGHNTGRDITDEDGNSVIGISEYMMYTCRNGWYDVRICLWSRY